MKTTLAALIVLAASLASAQTQYPFIPDQALYNFQHSQDYNQVWTTWNRYTTTGILYSSAQCAGPGIQPNYPVPGTYTGFYIGGSLAYKGNPALPPVCGPLDVSGSGIEQSWNSAGYPDHTTQSLAVIATGSLPGGQAATDNQTEACSLIGDDGSLGEAHTTTYNPGRCYYTGGPYAPM